MVDRRLLEAHELTRFETAIAAAAVPCLVGRRAGPDDRARSWLGGFPRVDDGFVWPTFEGRPSSFVAQLACADLDLPAWRDGYLLFFWDRYHAGFDRRDRGSAVVMYQHGQRALGPHDIPIGEGSWFFGLIRRRLSAMTYTRKDLVIVPGESFSADVPSELKREGGDGDWTAAYLEFWGDSINDIQIGGAPAPVNDEAAYQRARCAELFQTGPDVEWVLLLQLLSIEDMVWGDAGSLCWYLPKEDLARGDLSRAWMQMSCC